MPEWPLSKLADLIRQQGLSAQLDGPDRSVLAVNTLDEAAEGQISFLSNPKYIRSLETTRASAVIVPEGAAVPDHLTVIRSNDPYAAITVAIVAIHGHRKHPTWGISEAATIDPTATLGEGANIAPGVTIEAGASVGRNTTIYPGCYIAQRVTVGENCILYPNVVIYNDCVLGDRVTIHAGSVIGQDGLGYAPRNGKWIKIPQVGRTVIADDVEIGACCAIDRATLGRTEIGPGTKFGNAVVIGHGTKVGPDCIFIGQVGVAGSVTVGRNVTLAGQAGVAGHLTIGDGVRVGAQSGVLTDVEPGVDVLGAPAAPMANARRAIAAYQKLPRWIQRIKDLEHEVKTLREQFGGSVDD